MFDRFGKIKVHFIGIGGIGMSGLAEILISRGHPVSGSDIQKGKMVDRLKKIGAEVFIGHKEDNIGTDVDVVVYSSAIDNSNPEVIKAKLLSIPLICRAEMLAEIMRPRFGLAVAGSHGKTTTTSLLATLLHEAKLDPTHIIGGVVDNLGGNARLGESDIIVAEADESDGSFLHLSPIMSIITNIDDDHLDYYQTKENLNKAFTSFANRLPFYGLCALNFTDKGVQSIADDINRPCVFFGIKGEKDQKLLDGKRTYLATDLSYDRKKRCSIFSVEFAGEKWSEVFELSLPGEHNILNALGAIALAHQLGVERKTLASGLKLFKGVGRRLELLWYGAQTKGVLFDDYAHHPTEIEKTLNALKSSQEKRPIVFFEPHRFSRTKHCWNEFLHCFNGAAKLYMLPIYPASEAPLPGIEHSRLVEDINGLHPGLAKAIDREELQELLKKEVEKEDALVITLGAGQIGRKVREFVENISCN